MDSFKTFSENKLTNRCKFFSSKEDYLKVDNIWNVFSMNTMGG